ncbi:MAG TPA: helix-turn-helix domain-containing protein [Stellaceae bacterium]|nr:helix-turn-helix domain-containing protein [Stellaceae bacterium]
MARKPEQAAALKPQQRQTKRRTRPIVAQAGPHPVDVHVSSRVRLARLLAGKTQQWLGAQVLLTFQQVQKSERRSNRISASMLAEFAQTLGRSIVWFFEDDKAAPDARKIDHAIGERQRLTYELTSNFAKIENEKVWQHFVGFVRAMAEAGLKG